MTLDELRTALKLLDLSLQGMQYHGMTSDGLSDLRDTVSELSEYALKQHATIERLKTRLNVMAERLNVPGS